MKKLEIIFLENCLRMDFHTLSHQNCTQILVLPWWPSGLRRQTILDRLVKNRGGVRGSKIFFSFFFLPFCFDQMINIIQLFIVSKCEEKWPKKHRQKQQKCDL